MKRILVRSGLLVAVALVPVLSCGQNTEAKRHNAKEGIDPYIESQRKEAEQGNAEAQCFLGGVYGSGLGGVTQDFTVAAKWYRKAADQGNAVAQSTLGSAYWLGQGVPQDHAEAIKWYRQAAEKGLADAQFLLGVAYLEGQGVAQDYAGAVKWLRKAADQGDDGARYCLGYCYEIGQGVPKDFAEAYKCYNLAAVSGNEVYIKARDILLSRMTQAQITEGQRRAAEFVVKKQGKHE